MPTILASAPVRLSSAVSPGSATPARSGRSFRLPLVAASPSGDLEPEGRSRHGAELVGHLDRDPRGAGAPRRTADDARACVDAKTRWKLRGPRPRRDPTGDAQPRA